MGQYGHDEHEENRPDLGPQPQKRCDRLGQEKAGRLRSEHAEQGRSQSEARDDLADHRRLVKPMKDVSETPGQQRDDEQRK